MEDANEYETPAEYDDYVFIDDLAVPLAYYPPAEEYAGGFIEIDDAPVPLGAMPQTGLESGFGVLTTGLMLSAFAAASIGTAIRKARKKG